MKIVVFQTTVATDWAWVVVAKNGRDLATSGFIFKTSGDAARSAKAFMRNLFKSMSEGDVPVEVE